MTSARWHQIKGILADALECSDDTERRALIQKRCGTDARLGAQVMEYLSAGAVDDGMFIKSWTSRLPRLRLAMAPAASPPQ